MSARPVATRHRSGTPRRRTSRAESSRDGECEDGCIRPNRRRDGRPAARVHRWRGTG